MDMSKITCQEIQGMLRLLAETQPEELEPDIEGATGVWTHEQET
jgi:hypothetical protein